MRHQYMWKNKGVPPKFTFERPDNYSKSRLKEVAVKELNGVAPESRVSFANDTVNKRMTHETMWQYALQSNKENTPNTEPKVEVKPETEKRPIIEEIVPEPAVIEHKEEEKERDRIGYFTNNFWELDKILLGIFGKSEILFLTPKTRLRSL